jgi:hypothetical protein
MQTAHIINREIHRILDILGPTIEILNPPEESDTIYCVMIGTIPAHASVPLHSHRMWRAFSSFPAVFKCFLISERILSGFTQRPATSFIYRAMRNMHFETIQTKRCALSLPPRRNSHVSFRKLGDPSFEKLAHILPLRMILTGLLGLPRSITIG